MRVEWHPHARTVFDRLPDWEKLAIERKARQLEIFPAMYAEVGEGGPFRDCRAFRGIHWMVYYRIGREAVYIVGLWPARLPLD